MLEEISLNEITSILCIALIINLTMGYWASYKQQLEYKTQQADYRESIAKNEKLVDQYDANAKLQGQLLERQLEVLLRVDELIAKIETKMDSRTAS